MPRPIGDQHSEGRGDANDETQSGAGGLDSRGARANRKETPDLKPSVQTERGEGTRRKGGESIGSSFVKAVEEGQATS